MVDDFETVGDKPKKQTRVPYKKLASQPPASQQLEMGSNDAGSRKTSDVAATVPTAAVRKASDAAGAAASKPPASMAASETMPEPVEAAPVQEKIPEPKPENLSVKA